MRVAITDGAPATRSRVREALDADVEVVGMDPVPQFELRCIERSDPDAVDRAEDLTRTVAILAVQPTPRLARRLSADAAGAVVLEAVERSLMPTLAALAAGQTAFPSALRAALRHPALSSREKQVLAMVVLDKSNAEIAERLWLTEPSVKNHLTSAFAKLGVRSRTEAAALIADADAGLGLGILRLGSEPQPGTAPTVPPVSTPRAAAPDAGLTTDA